MTTSWPKNYGPTSTPSAFDATTSRPAERTWLADRVEDPYIQ
ncbi:hypothetical protein [Mycobacteroides abscessus]|nr:hypothetical protein [Mycobacteroides abscessus]